MPPCHDNEMMSNERQRQLSTPVMVAKDNLKQTETKGYPLQNKTKKTKKKTLNGLLLHWVGRGRPCRLNSNALNSPPMGG